MIIRQIMFEELARLCADLVKEGVTFEALPDEVYGNGLWQIKFTGGNDHGNS